MPTSWRDLLALADAAAPDFRKAFLASVAAADKNIDLLALKKALASKDLTKTADVLTVAWTTATPGWQAQVAKDTLSLLSDAGSMTMATTVTGGAFDLLNPRAIRWAQSQSSQLVKYVTDQQRAAIREVVGRAMSGEFTYATAARELRSMNYAIGLDPRRASALASFADRTSTRVQAFIASKPNWSAARKQALVDRAQRKVDRYSKRLLKARTETIARTETMASANQGMLEAWQQAIETGKISPNLVKKWITTPDDRRCVKICKPMQGQMTRVDAAFTVPLVGQVQRPPAHPNCRCVMALVRPPRTMKNVQGAPPLPTPKPPTPPPPINLMAPPALPSLPTAPPKPGAGLPIKQADVQVLSDLTRPLDASDVLALGKSDAAIYLEQLELPPSIQALIADLESSEFLQLTFTSADKAELIALIQNGLVTPNQLGRLIEWAQATYTSGVASVAPSSLKGAMAMVDEALTAVWEGKGSETAQTFVEFKWNREALLAIEDLRVKDYYTFAAATENEAKYKNTLLQKILNRADAAASAHPEDAFNEFIALTKADPLWWQTERLSIRERIGLRWGADADLLSPLETKQAVLAMTRAAREHSLDPLLGWTVKSGDQAGSLEKLWVQALHGNPQPMIDLTNDDFFRAELYKLINEEGFDDPLALRLLLRKTLDMDTVVPPAAAAASPQAVVVVTPKLPDASGPLKGPYKTKKTASQAKALAPEGSPLKTATVVEENGQFFLKMDAQWLSDADLAVQNKLVTDVLDGKLVAGTPLTKQQADLLDNYAQKFPHLPGGQLSKQVVAADPAAKAAVAAGSPPSLPVGQLQKLIEDIKLGVLDDTSTFTPAQLAALKDYHAVALPGSPSHTLVGEILKAQAPTAAAPIVVEDLGVKLATRAINGELGTGALFGDDAWKALFKVYNDNVFDEVATAKIRAVLKTAKPVATPKAWTLAAKQDLLDDLLKNAYGDVDTYVFSFGQKRALEEIYATLQDGTAARAAVAKALGIPLTPAVTPVTAAAAPLPTGVVVKGPYKTWKTAKQAIVKAPANAPLKQGKIVSNAAGQFEIHIPTTGVPPPAGAAQASSLSLPAAQPIASSSFTPTTSWVDDLLTRQLSGAKGSNPGGLYQTASGEQFYVKFYADPLQGMNEVVANHVYRSLGAQAPEAWVVRTGANKVAYVSRVLDNTGTLHTGLDATRANAILDHFVADVFTQNWDAVGTGLDNVVLLRSGGLARIDQGGAFLFRAQGARKPVSALSKLDEWDSFFTRNAYYRQVFETAGYADGADALGARALRQIDDLVAFRKRLDARGGWQAFVEDALAGAPASAEKSALIRDLTDTLDTRYKLLVAKRNEITRAIAAARVPVPPEGPPTIVRISTMREARTAARSRPGAGGSFAWDGDEIEDLSVQLRGVKIAHQDFVEVKFKLTESAGDALEQALKRDGKTALPFRTPKQTYPNGVNTAAVIDFGDTHRITSGLGSSGKTYRQESGPLRFNFHRSTSASHGPFALHNTVQIWIAGDPTEAAIRQALKDVARITANAAPSETQLAAYAENRLARVFQVGNGPMTPNQKRQALDRAKREFGISTANLRVTTDELGRVIVEFDDGAAKRIAQKTGVDYFVHSLHSGGSDAAHLADVLSRDHHAMLSSTKRATEGVGEGGCSSSDDLHTGGADYFFTRQRAGQPYMSGGEIFINKRVLRRTDWFAYTRDEWGANNPGDGHTTAQQARDNFKNLKTHDGNCETMFKHRISFDDIDAFVVDSNRVKQDVLAILRRRGITRLGGRPIEDFVRVSGDRF